MADMNPSFATPTGMGGGAPSLPDTPPLQPQVQMQPPAPAAQPVQPSPQDISIGHDTLFGRAAKTLMGGNTSYHVDENGNTVAVQSPNTFQSFAKNVLAASLLGAAAGANGNPAQGFAGGLVRGGAAEVGQQEQQDQLKRQEAQREFQNKQAVETQDRQNILMQAQLQNMHSEMVARDRTSDLQSKEYHDKHNAASAALEKNLTEAGGTPASIPVGDGVKSVFTAPELAAAFTKDPQILQGPNGSFRHFIDTTDSSELTFNGHNWVDASGEPVNMSDRTTVKAIDVPADVMKTKVPTSGKDINTIYGGKLVDPDKTYPMSPLELDNLNTKRMNIAGKQSVIDKNKSDEAYKRIELGLKSRELALREREAAGGAKGEGAPDPSEIAEAIHSGRGTLEQLTQGMGKEAASFRRQVEAIFLNKYPNDNLQALKSYGKQADSPAVQSQLVAARSLFGMNGDVGSLDTLESALRRVPKASMPMLSKLKQDTAYNLGSPEMATVKALKTDLGTELAKFNTGGGNATSDHQIELFREQLNEAQTPEQVEKVLSDIRNVSSKRLHALVGANPYLHYMTSDVNDPVTKQPRGQVNNHEDQAARQPGIPNLSNIMVNPQTNQQIGWNGKQWVDVNTGQPAQ